MLSDLDIFFGDANNAEARVYARITGADAPPDCQLTGRVVGPMCEYSRTLSAAIPLIARPGSAAAEPSLLAEAIVPDPCFWSQDLPFLYRAEIELRRGGQVLAVENRTFGVRPLGVRKRRLVWESRPWVLRAADCRELPEQELAAWRAADLAMLVEDPNDDLCREASRLGVVLVAKISADGEAVAAELRRLSRWPAIAMAILPAGHFVPDDLRGRTANLLFAEQIAAAEPVAASSWTDVVVCEDPDADTIALQASAVSRAVVAHRPTGWRDGLAELRRACDHLQRDLAARGDFTGYIV